MITAIVTDIEGTTGSIAFVKDVLFPFASAHLPDFVRARAQAGDARVRRLLDEAAALAGIAPGDDEPLLAALLAWIREDRKATPLKALQGLVWEAGYRSGELVAHVYDDALRNLERWHMAGLPLYVYSSGSVDAQRLYFAHTERGDVSGWFAGFFDTQTGAKREAESYRSILAALGRPGPEVLFLSDVEAELDAAREAGMWTTLVVRAPSDPVSGRRHPAVRTFDDVQLGGPSSAASGLRNTL